ncbi:Anthranilate N-benzoyltransferase protein, putative [Ricinus communis]|uniref:Anthranilate N-benzoyltransferase protein, putative n=1 Tax=Ricinus communis TaxID=3988 RepID=B9RJY1_RICCO|nr:Anthranilate N-benzoyltransferase protein, putative [Ricinus communis]|eukprot:XP_002514050.1 protein ECERIFERUM 2 [Ricinus communis]
MAPPTPSTPVSGVRLSTVVPAEVTGESNQDYKLTNMDLALKLHYIKGVYFFAAEAVQGLTTSDLKRPMFPCLSLYYTASGRIRRSETGRPFIKCNDSGVRIVEAFCDRTIEEWMATDNDLDSFLLAHDQVLGPDLGFTPLVYIQFTWFKCGGLSVGLSWAHVLGDPFSASNFINNWAQFTQGHVPCKSLHVPNTNEPECPPSIPREPFSLKRVDPVGDYWLTTNNCKMETYSFVFTAKQLDTILSESAISDLFQSSKISHFEVISAIIWKLLSKIREDSGPRIATICTRKSRNHENEVSSNKMVFSTVRADFSVAKGGVDELAALIAEKQEGENRWIEGIMECDKGDDQSNYIAYGANLTFVNMEEANIYGLELKEHKPVYANYTINGVGDEGAVIVLPAGPDKGSNGRRVTLILPEDQLKELKYMVREEWGTVLR